MMEGYSILKTRVDRFLRDNPDVVTVTLKRPKPQAAKATYASGSQECYGRVPETCPVLREIIDSYLFEGDVLTRADGTQVDISELRNDLFREIHDRITMGFRREFEEVCEHKHGLLAHLKSSQYSMAELIRRCETELPEDKSRRRREVEVVVSEDEIDD